MSEPLFITAEEAAKEMCISKGHAYVAFINVVKTVVKRPDENREIQRFLIEECQKLDRLIEQQNLLCDNDIETDEELYHFIDECKEEMAEITESRKQLRNRLVTAQRHGDTDEVSKLKSDISLFTERLKILRSNLKISDRILKQKPIIDEKIDTLVERQQEIERNERFKNNRTERGRSR